jgi:hypothetical protein
MNQSLHPSEKSLAWVLPRKVMQILPNTGWSINSSASLTQTTLPLAAELVTNTQILPQCSANYIECHLSDQKRKCKKFFWNLCMFRLFDHPWSMTRESSSAFSTTKACIRTKFTPDLRRNSRMIVTVSIAFNVGASTFGRSEKIKNDQVGPPLDSSTRKLSPVLIDSYFIQHIQLLRPLTFHTRWYFTICKIRLVWKTFIFDGSRRLALFLKRSQEFFDVNSIHRVP